MNKKTLRVIALMMQATNKYYAERPVQDVTVTMWTATFAASLLHHIGEKKLKTLAKPSKKEKKAAKRRARK